MFKIMQCYLNSIMHWGSFHGHGKFVWAAYSIVGVVIFAVSLNTYLNYKRLSSAHELSTQKKN